MSGLSPCRVPTRNITSDAGRIADDSIKDWSRFCAGGACPKATICNNHHRGASHRRWLLFKRVPRRLALCIGMYHRFDVPNGFARRCGELGAIGALWQASSTFTSATGTIDARRSGHQGGVHYRESHQAPGRTALPGRLYPVAEAARRVLLKTATAATESSLNRCRSVPDVRLPRTNERSDQKPLSLTPRTLAFPAGASLLAEKRCCPRIAGNRINVLR